MRRQSRKQIQFENWISHLHRKMTNQFWIQFNSILNGFTAANILPVQQSH